MVIAIVSASFIVFMEMIKDNNQCSLYCLYYFVFIAMVSVLIAAVMIIYT